MCNHHKAGQELTVRWVGQDVTGVGLFSCARHTCALPRGAVDFFKGEKLVLSFILWPFDHLLIQTRPL